MKMIKYETLITNLKLLSKSFKSKRGRKVSRSDPSYSSSSDTSSSIHTGRTTPQTVLPDNKFSDFTSALIHQAFNLIDLNGDGKISVTELELILNRVAGSGRGPTKEEVATMLTELDIDGDGCISLEEFVAIGSDAFEKPARRSELKDAFDYFDVNGDGGITAEELLDGLSKLGDNKSDLSECKRMIAEVDANKDGYVCFEDFSRMMTSA